MYILRDEDTDSIIGPFETSEDAISFTAKVEELSKYNISVVELYDVTSPDEWLQENMDNILMANF